MRGLGGSLLRVYGLLVLWFRRYGHKRRGLSLAGEDGYDTENVGYVRCRLPCNEPYRIFRIL